MLQGMNLGDAPQETVAADKGESILFAVHALAVIDVHDSEEAQKVGLSLKEISMKDPYLATRVDTVTSYLFRSFGRNCKAVFERYLDKVWTPEELEQKVKGFAHNIRRDLGI